MADSTPTAKEVITTVFAAAAWIENDEALADPFIQEMVSQIVNALIFFGWLRSMPER